MHIGFLRDFLLLFILSAPFVCVGQGGHMDVGSGVHLFDTVRKKGSGFGAQKFPRAQERAKLIDSVRDSIGREAENLKEIHTNIHDRVNQSAGELQYDSDRPGDVPLKDVDPLEEGRQFLMKPRKMLGDFVDSLKGPAWRKDVRKPATTLQNLQQNQMDHRIDSLNHWIQAVKYHRYEEILSAKRIYSDRYIRRLYDSLGLSKADSILGIATKLSREEAPKQQLLQYLNSETVNLTQLSDQLGNFERENLNFEVQGELTRMQEEYQQMAASATADLSSLRLPDEELGQFPPLPGLQLDRKTLHLIDSLRQSVLEARKLRMHESRLTDKITKTTFDRNLSIFDRSYFEGILGVVNDTAFTIIQIAPSFGYRFTDNFSLGLGPVLSVEYQQRDIHAVVGFRSFAKWEFWKQRLYFQFEDNARSSPATNDYTKGLQHSLLGGLGGLIPLSERLAINVGIFYRINQNALPGDGNPWVLRVGLSSVKNMRP